MAKKEEPKKYEERQPPLRRKIRLSKDRQYLIIEVIRTELIHMNYLDKILAQE